MALKDWKETETNQWDNEKKDERIWFTVTDKSIWLNIYSYRDTKMTYSQHPKGWGILK